MHLRTHPKPQIRGQAGRWQSEYHDVMVEHDQIVGKLLQKLDDLGIVEDTIVMYDTDNGPHMNSWPDAGMTLFRNEKDSNWEGAFRVPCMVRWLGLSNPAPSLMKSSATWIGAADGESRSSEAGNLLIADVCFESRAWATRKSAAILSPLR